MSFRDYLKFRACIILSSLVKIIIKIPSFLRKAFSEMIKALKKDLISFLTEDIEIKLWIGGLIVGSILVDYFLPDWFVWFIIGYVVTGIYGFIIYMDYLSWKVKQKRDEITKKEEAG